MAAEPATPPVAGRLASLDAYRGFSMLLMASEGLRIGQVAESLPGSPLWAFLAYQTEHVEWIGCTVWDLIQPSFMYMVGVALPFSMASRAAQGQSFARRLVHAAWRALLLVSLGIFLRSVGRTQTYFTFEDVLTQIGLGYVFLFLLGHTRPRTQAIAAGLILAGTWAAFALTPLPGPGYDYPAVGLGTDWPRLQGFEAHWEKNANLAHWADVAFLNWFPREKPFTHNGGGYETLSFVPSLATMLFGLLAGGWLRGPATPTKKAARLALWGLAGLLTGWLLGALGICPVVKRIWTPSWTIFAAGWTSLFLAGWYLALDVWKLRGWAFPFIVVGMNSIFMYCAAHLIDHFIASSWKTHLGQHIFEVFGTAYAPLVQQAAVLFTLWCILLWLHRRRTFFRL